MNLSSYSVVTFSNSSLLAKSNDIFFNFQSQSATSFRENSNKPTLSVLKCISPLSSNIVAYLSKKLL